MTLSNKETNAFIVRLWTETRSVEQSQAALWRGVIEHVQTGERHAFENLDQVLEFIRQRSHLEKDKGDSDEVQF